MLKKQAEKFFKWYCNPDYFEDIKGDLDELYHRQMEVASAKAADIQYTKEVFKLFRPTIIRPIKGLAFTNQKDMIRNYFKIALRNLLKHKPYTAIHILGLALGLAAFLLINQYTSFEKSYDTYHYQPDQLYRLTTDNIVDGKLQVGDAMSFAPSGKALMDELPEIISYTTTYKTWRMIFKKGEEPIEEELVTAVDSNFLNLFKYKLVKGTKENILNEPNTLVLTESMARKYFGEADPMGKSIEVLGRYNRPFEVVGVMEDVPENTHYPFNALVSLKTLKERVERDAWNGFNYYTYLLLDKNADLEQLEAKLPPLAKKYIGEESNLYFNLQPVPSIHLESDLTFEPGIHGSSKAVNFLSIISLFILIIAWVNYVNLSTARAVERAKEVGLRKVVGARKRQLIGQFLVESMLINFLGAIAAIMLAELLLPYFNNLVGKTVLTEVWTNPDFLQKLGIFFLLGTFVAGFYPAIVLSSFSPIGVLKGTFSRSKQGVLLRKGLVIVQFAASLILIANTLIVYKQVNYMTNRDKGMDINKVIGFQNPQRSQEESETFESKYEAFSEALEKLEGVDQVGGMSNLPGGGSADISSNSGGIKIVGKTERINSTIYMSSIDEQARNTLDVKLIAGRDFNPEFADDTAAIIVNLSVLERLNINDPSSILNEKVQFGRDPDNDKYQIVGIYGNFNRTTLKNHVEPTVFFFNPAPSNTLARLSGDKPSTTVAAIQDTWKQFFPDAPFEYTFLDQRFAKLYQEDKKFGFIFANFSILAIIVASLGLFGLASFLSVQRTKEVGVRKVLGASVSNIVLLFFKDFVWLILISVIVGIPLIYLSMNQWLNNYAYRIDFPWWVALVAMFAVSLFAFITVGYQTYKVAILNPARTIRHE